MTGFLATAVTNYRAANAETLAWMLGRQWLPGDFLNTKQSSVTLEDYRVGDGQRGPDFLYGWIQGRGLEALVHHAVDMRRRGDPGAAGLDAAIRRLDKSVGELLAADGHAYYCYDAARRPIRIGAAGDIIAQDRPADIFTAADAYVGAGRMVAALHLGLPDRVEMFTRQLEARAAGRFMLSERGPLTAAAARAEPGDYAVEMTLIGVALGLHRMGHPQAQALALPLVEAVLATHYDAESGLLADVPGGDSCSPGHCLEFTGFALACIGSSAPAAMVAQLARITRAAFRRGFDGIAIAGSISISKPSARVGDYAWWPVPEAIRAAAFCYELTGDAEFLEIWRQADASFFNGFWRPGHGIAYQMRDRAGPVDRVPSTPDLDPGYHTGLCLLDAANCAERLLARQGQGSPG